MKGWLAILLAAGLAVATPSDAAEPAAIERFALPNGLEVIVIPNHRVPAVSHMLWFRVGAADDPPGKSGLAHFHEHVMFLGAAGHRAGEYANLIAAHGGEQNAFTGYDATSYYVDISKDELPLVMKLEADRMRGLAPSDAAIATEKEIIIEERRARVENNPQALLAEQMNAALFRNHPYHWPVIGWMHEMQGLTKADVLEFHRRWYHAGNAMLIISGDITAAELKPLAQKYYGPLPRQATPPRRWREEPPQIAARRIIMHHANVKHPVWSRLYAVSSLGWGKKEQALPLFVLSQILGGGKTSRLYQSLVVEEKMASGVDTSYGGFNVGPAQFEISIIPEQGVDPAALEKAVDAELQKIMEGELGAEELVRAKTLLKASSMFARDGLASMARIMGWLRIAGLDQEYFNRWPQLIEAVSAEEVKAAAGEALQMRQSVTALLLPGEGKESE